MPENLTFCIPEGQTNISLTLSDVYASNADGNAVNCTANGNIDVQLAGHDFAMGSYTIVCSVENNAGCGVSKTFQQIVSGQ